MSKNQSQKWQFLTDVMRFGTATLATTPLLFMSSLPNRLGPLWEHFLLARKLGAADFSCAQEIANCLVKCTDAEFAALHSCTASSPLPLYKKAFQQQWQQRWHFLVDNFNIAIADIGRHPAVLQTSSKEILGPCWAFLVSVAGHIQGFNPTHHLTALSSLSDKEFSDVFNIANKGLVYSCGFIQHWQQANRHVWNCM